MNIFDVAQYSFNPHAVPFWFVGILLFIEGVFVLLRNYRSPVNISFFAMTLATSIWLTGNGINFSIQSNMELVIIWSKILWLGVIFISPSTFSFTLCVLDLPDKRRRILLAYLAFIPFALLLPFGYVQQGVWRLPWRYHALAGPLEIPFLAFFFTQMIYIFYLYYRELKNPSLLPQKRQQVRLLFLAFIFAYFGAFDFLPNFGVVYYSLGYLPTAIWLTAVAYIIARYELFKVNMEIIAQTVIATMPDMLFVTDSEGRIALVNSSAAQIVGLAPAEIIGRDLDQMIPLTAKLQEKAKSSGKSGVLVLGEEAYITAGDRGRVPVSISASIVYDTYGRFGGIVIICHNIQKLRDYIAVIDQRTNQLDAQRKVLEEKNQELEGVKTNLEEKLRELQEFQNATVNRELRLMEMEKENKKLMEQIARMRESK